jgi:hypothetical protein
MATITDFNVWLFGVDSENHHDVYNIYLAVKHMEESDGFSCSVKETANGNMYFLKCDYIDEILMLASDKARDAFLLHLEKTYAGKDNDIESWYSFKEAMAKED